MAESPQSHQQAKDDAAQELALLQSVSPSTFSENVEPLTKDNYSQLASNTLEATERYRKNLFIFAVILVGTVTLVSSGALLWSLWVGPVNATLISAYFASVTVQVVGVLTVVAKSIFPADHLQQVKDLYQVVDKTATHRMRRSQSG